MQVDDSQYWREELVRIAQSLRFLHNPPRWSVRRQNVLERDIAIGFFVIRKLHEHEKLSSLAQYTDVHVLRHALAAETATAGRAGTGDTETPETGRNLLKEGRVSYLNKHRFLSKYDFHNGTSELCHFIDLSNQFIHGYASATARDATRNWNTIYLAPQKNRNTTAWSVSVRKVAQLFRAVAQDYPCASSSFLGPREQNEKKERERDYLTIAWSTEGDYKRLRELSALIQNTSLDRAATIQAAAKKLHCSQGLVRRLYKHLLHWQAVPRPCSPEAE